MVTSMKKVYYIVRMSDDYVYLSYNIYATLVIFKFNQKKLMRYIYSI